MDKARRKGLAAGAERARLDGARQALRHVIGSYQGYTHAQLAARIDGPQDKHAVEHGGRTYTVLVDVSWDTWNAGAVMVNFMADDGGLDFSAPQSEWKVVLEGAVFPAPDEA